MRHIVLNYVYPETWNGLISTIYATSGPSPGRAVCVKPRRSYTSLSLRSAQLRLFEESLGQKLFRRGGRNLVLNEMGQVVLLHKKLSRNDEASFRKTTPVRL